ncbi:hypothetical protein PR048_018428 [Dryococelus australis]|uniref:Tc1-like transposase DDE domain-containing protein n=1 Tax=Dryococelus australis TaxID=614101 RepID=A0ABQ9HC90_9NEOP|nr:hypothetical protein PR048_018428 [Dryococelus australis]
MRPAHAGCECGPAGSPRIQGSAKHDGRQRLAYLSNMLSVGVHRASQSPGRISPSVYFCPHASLEARKTTLARSLSATVRNNLRLIADGNFRRRKGPIKSIHVGFSLCLGESAEIGEMKHQFLSPTPVTYPSKMASLAGKIWNPVGQSTFGNVHAGRRVSGVKNILASQKWNIGGFWLVGGYSTRADKRLWTKRKKTFLWDLGAASKRLSLAKGATVAERLACSPSTKTNRVQSSAGFAPGFSHVGIVPDDAAGRRVLSRRSPVSLRPFLSFRRCCVVASLHPHRLPRPRFYEPTNSLHSRKENFRKLRQTDNAQHSAPMKWYADNNVRRLDWPAQNPDLNPIEHHWDELDRRVRARQARPKSIAQLMEWLQEEWRRIPVDVLQTLIESMPDRVAAVIAAIGRDSGIFQLLTSEVLNTLVNMEHRHMRDSIKALHLCAATCSVLASPRPQCTTAAEISQRGQRQPSAEQHALNFLFRVAAARKECARRFATPPFPPHPTPLTISSGATTIVKLHHVHLRCRFSSSEQRRKSRSPTHDLLVARIAGGNNGTSLPYFSHLAPVQWYADNNVRRLDWPTQSPDLNPIEYLWYELDRRVRARQARPKSIAQLMEWLQEERR